MTGASLARAEHDVASSETSGRADRPPPAPARPEERPGAEDRAVPRSASTSWRPPVFRLRRPRQPVLPKARLMAGARMAEKLVGMSGIEGRVPTGPFAGCAEG